MNGPRRLSHWLEDFRAARRGDGPASFARWWPRHLRAAFPGPRRLTEQWAGDGASFARYDTPHGPLFLKCLSAGEREGRYFRRFRREIEYLRDLAPLVDVPHAPLLHAELDAARRRAHLLTPDLTARTWGWGRFQTEAEREGGLHDIARLLAHFHAAWAGHSALKGVWTWQPDAVCTEAAEFAHAYGGPHAPAVQQAAAQLPDLLAAAPHWGLVHGDIHAGQVVWPRDGSPPLLLDYGQVHPGLPGEDLAHLLTVRLDAGERARYGDGVRAAYWNEVARRGLDLTPAEQMAQERAGIALNLLATARQAQREPGEGVSAALENVVQAWRDLR
ncbi:MAG: phosphotransferase [Deinococcus sp.]|uniref:phosphotransferase family protein n=1 Tax=Deinococcus sp. TaxID=47478 RepID=UPI0026DD573F|nr:phosphotransferase [Deinococcus sp.]MDO4244407.1 phosphotransferase [Deinococcus sp.]